VPATNDQDSLGESGYREAWSPFGDPDARDPDPEVRSRFFGKYRGTVMNNKDPLNRGRLLVQVVDVLGLGSSSWAMPCVPFAGLAMGSFSCPLPGTGVWVEFEQGDPQKPIWTGCFWGPPHTMGLAGEAAFALPFVPAPPVITLETGKNGISISEVPLGLLGSVNIRCGATSIMMTDAALVITAPAVAITTAAFTVNKTALVVAGP
jgi:Type VI secretion system/phage-baseplate injector OB domain